MSKGYPILLVVHPVSFVGTNRWGEEWDGLLTLLRRGLASGGLEAKDSLSELLLFNFDHPLTAVASFFEQLEKIEKKYGRGQNGDKLPLQIVLHQEIDGETPPSFRYTNSSAWEELEHQIIYLSPALKLQWDKWLEGRQESLPHEIEDRGRFAIVRFPRPAALRRKRIFPYRALLAESGGNRPCFYCGLRTHLPSSCPAKQLSMANFSLPDIGYQPMGALVRNFQAAFSKRQEMEAKLGPGVELEQIRKNPPLQSFVAFFDLLAVYQPRYLRQVVFSVHAVWSGLNPKSSLKPDSRNLEMGLDCLRVGQYDQAKQLLMAENQAMGGKQYGSAVGLAFLALERGRFEEMGHHLQIASSTASVEKEKIHIALLLARYHDLANHQWKSEQALQGMANLYVDCHEIVHRRIQTAVSGGQGARELKNIGALIEASRHYFMNVLMDPVLLPIEGLLEELVGNHLRATKAKADETLTAAVAEYERLRRWVDGKDEDFDRNLEALANLLQQREKGAYFDLLDVLEKARSLKQAGPRLQENKLDELNEQIDDAVLEWEKFQRLWQEYPYKSFWRRAEEQMRRVRKQLVDARSAASESLRKGRDKLAQARQELQSFSGLVKRMNRLRLMLDGLRIFAGRLAVAEVAVSVLLLVLYPTLTIGLADQLGSDTVAMLKDSTFQKRLIFAANGVLAPLIALAQTARRLTP